MPETEAQPPPPEDLTPVYVVYTGRRLWTDPKNKNKKKLAYTIIKPKGDMDDVLAQCRGAGNSGYWDTEAFPGRSAPTVGSVFVYKLNAEGKVATGMTYLGIFEKMVGLPDGTAFPEIADRKQLQIDWATRDWGAYAEQKRLRDEAKERDQPDPLEKACEPLWSAYWNAPPSQRPAVLARIIYFVQKGPAR